MSAGLMMVVLGTAVVNMPSTPPDVSNHNSVPSVKDTLPDPLLQLQARRSDYTYTPGLGAHKIHTQAATWNEARRACEEEGGYLAIVNSVAESKVIDELIKNSETHTYSANPHSAYIGISELYGDGDWVTIHGESLAVAGFDAWLPGEPSHDGSNAHCGSLFHGKLNDVMCDVRLAYVCELPQGSPQSTSEKNPDVAISLSV